MQQKEIDLQAVLEQRNKKAKVAEELQQQFKAESKMLEEKYSNILDEYRPAYDELQCTIDVFHKKWNPLLISYHNEMKSIHKKFKRLFKAL